MNHVLPTNVQCSRPPTSNGLFLLSGPRRTVTCKIEHMKIMPDSSWNNKEAWYQSGNHSCKIAETNNYRREMHTILKCSHCKENFLFVYLYQYEKMDGGWTSWDNHFTIYVNKTTTVYALNMNSDICQLFLSKTGRKSFSFSLFCVHT